MQIINQTIAQLPVKVGDVLIENVNLVAEEFDYDYRERMLFCVSLPITTAPRREALAKAI